MQWHIKWFCSQSEQVSKQCSLSARSRKFQAIFMSHNQTRLNYAHSKITKKNRTKQKTQSPLLMCVFVCCGCCHFCSIVRGSLLHVSSKLFNLEISRLQLQNHQWLIWKLSKYLQTTEYVYLISVCNPFHLLTPKKECNISKLLRICILKWRK